MHKLKRHKFKILLSTNLITLIILSLSTIYLFTKLNSVNSNLAGKISENQELLSSLQNTQTELTTLQSQDQYVINQELEKKVSSIEDVYTNSTAIYESLLKLKENVDNTEDLDILYKEAIVLLAEKHLEEASDKFNDLKSQIDDANKKYQESLAAATPAPAPVNNTPPGSGYSRQQVSTNIGNYTVSLIAADLSSTRVIVDTASASSCPNNCPVLSLGEYVSRNGAYAGINGSYFCPATYPSCAGKENSFDTLLMNKDKTYFNSDNNVYSNVPAVIFGGSWIRFVDKSSDWGRDTSIDSMLANQALLIHGNNIRFTGDGDPKKGSRGARSFVANKGNTVYIGVVSNATVAEAAIALHTLGMENALNLDSGGSTALWHGGYKIGPGRNIPNAILFIQK